MAAAPLHRPDLVAEQGNAPPFGRRRFPGDDPPVRVGTTGTGADLLLLAWSASDLAREVAAGVRVLGRLGVRAGARVGNTLPGALATPGALLLGDVNEAIGALDVPLGVVDADAAARAAWDLVDRVQCEVLVLDPSTAPAFFQAAPGVARSWWRGIVWLERGEGHAQTACSARLRRLAADVAGGAGGRELRRRQLRARSAARGRERRRRGGERARGARGTRARQRRRDRSTRRWLRGSSTARAAVGAALELTW